MYLLGKVVETAALAFFFFKNRWTLLAVDSALGHCLFDRSYSTLFFYSNFGLSLPRRPQGGTSGGDSTAKATVQIETIIRIVNRSCPSVRDNT